MKRIQIQHPLIQAGKSYMYPAHRQQEVFLLSCFFFDHAIVLIFNAYSVVLAVVIALDVSQIS